MNPSQLVPFLLLAGLTLVAGRAPALEIQFSRPKSPDALLLAAGKSVASIFVATNEDCAVLRAVADLAEDFARVTGKKPPVKYLFPGAEKTGVIVGTLGRSEIIDQLVAAKKLDVSGVCGAWESYVLQLVNDPVPGMKRALVIAGSDRRGTIFGAYELSERIGVSPWNWWADVPVKPRQKVFISGGRCAPGPPAVKYRGIFLNDEDYGLRPWASLTFDPETKNIGPKTYAKIFELLLRLRANCLWPAMHHGSRAFNRFPENKEVADRYGIVMGSSHCE